ncbi:MAG: N-acetylmuramoyl-L-alanine amidase [Trueperaceae bacterium]
MTLVIGLAGAQTLSVNGREVAGLTLSLVDGVSYAPARPLSEALGARMTIDYSSGLVSLELGGRLVVLPTFNQPGGAGGPAGSWHVNGVQREGRGAVFDEGQLFLPVSAVAQAFLGYTTYVPDRERVMVVLPRGRMVDLEAVRRGNSDRLVITLGANVPYLVYYNEPLNALELHFDRTDTAGVGAVEDGRFFTRAAALSSRGGAEIRVSLEEGVDFSTYTVPDGRGYQLVIDLFAEVEEALGTASAPRVVIDAAHGGDDLGMSLAGSSESDRTLEVSDRLAQALRQRGLSVELSRSEDHDLPLTSRSGRGMGADLFLSIHVHPTSDRAISVYYLAEAAGAAGLDMAVRQNAETELADTTDDLRRRLLLNLVPDIEVGRRYAQGLQSELFAQGGLSVADPQPAPLAVLAGSAGRGLLIELPAEITGQQSDDEALIDDLADAVATLLLGRESVR